MLMSIKVLNVIILLKINQQNKVIQVKAEF
jgi:hypothetical protein